VKTFFRKTALSLGVVLLATLSVFGPACRSRRAADHKASVVKVYTTIQNVDFYEPWKPGAQATLQGCGCILPGGLILTTAHLINKATYIEVQKFGETKRYVAKAGPVGYDLDLAILRVDDPEFTRAIVPVEMGKLPAPGDKVTIFGKDELSVKEDTLSGLDMVWGAETIREVPALITNEAIDDKNNGCPVFKDGKLVGIPFDATGKADKKGSIIPVNVIERFLRSVQNGRAYDGFPDSGVVYQELESPALRAYYKVPQDQSGVVVTKVLYGGSAEGLLKEGDVLTAVDGQPIDSEGTIKVDKVHRVSWEYRIVFCLMGEKVKLDVLREGKPLKVEMPLKPLPKLVVYREDSTEPTYFMYAGFVFVPLTGNYFQTAEYKSFKPALKNLYSHGFLSEKRKQVVLISHILPHDINTGYARVANAIVTKVNGREITGIKDLVAALDHPVDRYQILEIDDHAWFGSSVVLDSEKAKIATQELMKNLRIPSDRSADLK